MLPRRIEATARSWHDRRMAEIRSELLAEELAKLPPPPPPEPLDPELAYLPLEQKVERVIMRHAIAMGNYPMRFSQPEEPKPEKEVISFVRAK